MEALTLKFPLVTKQFVDYLTSEEKDKSRVLFPLTYKAVDLGLFPLPVCPSILEHYSKAPEFTPNKNEANRNSEFIQSKAEASPISESQEKSNSPNDGFAKPDFQVLNSSPNSLFTKPESQEKYNSSNSGFTKLERQILNSPTSLSSPLVINTNTMMPSSSMEHSIKPKIATAIKKSKYLYIFLLIFKLCRSKKEQRKHGR